MIVVDTNVIAYLLLPSPWSSRAEALLCRDPDWVAPILWRSELRNVLSGYARRGALDFGQALSLQGEAEALLQGREHQPDSQTVLELAAASDCTAYDCEFVATALALELPLVTMDQKLLCAFPDIARALAAN